MDNSPLSTIAPELRNRIYEYALYQSSPFTIDAWYTFVRFQRSPSRADTPPHPAALAETCQAIREECLQLFYTLNTFVIKGETARHMFLNLYTFRNGIGAANAVAVGTIILDIGEVSKAFLLMLQELLTWTEVAAGACKDVWGADFRVNATVRSPGHSGGFEKAGDFLLYVDLDYADLEGSWDECIGRLYEAIREGG